MSTTAVISHQKASTIVDNVQQAQADVAQAFALLQSAKERLHAVLGPYHDTLWDGQLSEYRLDDQAEKSARIIERNGWQYLVNQMGFTAYMTERRQKELQEQLHKGTFPPLTLDNILSTLHNLASQVDTLLHESAREVFQWLRPHHTLYKTNKPWSIGRKVIVQGVEEAYRQGFRLNHWRTADFRALGNVLSLLDGRGAQHYPDDLCTQLADRLKDVEPGQEVLTPYLTLKPYHNGNAHLTFLRMDLIDKLNQLAGDSSLPGDAHAA